MCAHTYTLQINSVANTQTTWTTTNWLRQNKSSNNRDSKNQDTLYISRLSFVSIKFYMEIFKWQKFLVLKMFKLSLYTPWRHKMGADAQLFFLISALDGGKWSLSHLKHSTLLPQQLLNRKLGWDQPGCLKRRRNSLAQTTQPVPLSCASAARSNIRCYAELSFLQFSFLSCILGGCRSDWLPGSERERASIL